MSYSVFMLILCRILELRFERNQSKADYSKNCGKKKMRAQFCLGLGKMHFNEKKIVENHKSVGAGARKIEKIVRFLPKFDLHFFNISRARKRCIIYILKS